MNKQVVTKNKTYNIHPVGYVEASKNNFQLKIFDPFAPALKELNKFSHVIVFWWAHKHDNEKSRNKIQTPLPYAEDTIAGVFACRAEYRPNPIATTICKIIMVDEKNGIVQIEYIDAFNRTPILDLKPYIPVSDRVKNVQVPEWFAKWPKWWEEAEKFFSKFFSN